MNAIIADYRNISDYNDYEKLRPPQAPPDLVHARSVTGTTYVTSPYVDFRNFKKHPGYDFVSTYVRNEIKKAIL